MSSEPSQSTILAISVGVLLLVGTVSAWHRLRTSRRTLHLVVKVPVAEVTARALAPLKLLCDQAFPLIVKGAIGLFLKGQDVEVELTETAKYWTIQPDLVPSRTSPDGRIVIVRRLDRRRPQ